MNNGFGKGFVIFVFTVHACLIWGGDIRGRVLTDAQLPAAGVEVYLRASDGLELTARTNLTGQFSFPSLRAGDYEVGVAPSPRLMVLEPECGFLKVRIKGTESANLRFSVIVTGVAVDFGRPTGGMPIPMSSGNSFQAGEPFSFAIRLGNFGSLNSVPQGFLLVGKFPTYSDQISVVIDDIQVATQFQNGVDLLEFSQSPSGILKLNFRSLLPPFLHHSGDLLILRGRVLSPQNNWLAMRNQRLCFSLDRVQFFYKHQFSNEPELLPFGMPWSRLFEVNTP